MSLLRTLAKVAIGVAVAKGMGQMTRQAKAGQAGGRPASRGGSGGAPGGLDDIMSDVLGGRAAPKAGARPGAQQGGTQRAGTQRAGQGMPGGQAMPGGLGGILEQLAGGGRGGGGIDAMLGQGGGLGGLLGGLLGGAAAGTVVSRASKGAPERGFGDLLNEALEGKETLSADPTQAQEAAAALMLRAMIQAAKADGTIDEAERAKLVGTLKDGGAEELQFVKDELAAPVDIAGLARQVPKGLEAQVYAMSVMAITLDDQSEAQYLHEFAAALGLDRARVNEVHAELGVPALYA